jgi:hypothetical protein
MQVRIVHSIASADWSFSAGQIVRAGKTFAPDEVPADLATTWLNSGLAEPVDDKIETAAMKRRK